MVILNQRDPKWKDIPLGSSITTTIGSHGCTISCVGMIAGLTPDEVNRRMLQASAYDVNFVIWGKVKSAIPWIEFIERGSSYDNEKVKSAITKYGACLVEVDYDGVINTPNDRHWVVYIGNQKLYDPWTGTEKPTSAYPITKGYATFKISPKPEEQTTQSSPLDGISFEGNLDNTIKYLFTENHFSEGDIRGGMEDFKRGTVQHLQGVIANLTTEKEEAVQSAKINAEQVVKDQEIIEQLKANTGLNEDEVKQRLDNQKKSLRESFDKEKAEALKTQEEKFSKSLFYKLDGGQLIFYGLQKIFGIDVTPKEGESNG